MTKWETLRTNIVGDERDSVFALHRDDGWEIVGAFYRPDIGEVQYWRRPVEEPKVEAKFQIDAPAGARIPPHMIKPLPESTEQSDRWP